MCETCGCQTGATATLINLDTGRTTPIGATDPHEHVHADGTRHSHPHTHDHSHTHEHHHVETIAIEQRILAKNDALAGRIRDWLAERGILALNLLSAPGAGKTTLLECTVKALAQERDVFVIEGDQATANDGERIRAAGAPVVQLNTGTGCHLDAEMVERALAELKPAAGALLMIENVGNLVCPALFDLGERAKVVLFSVTEGEDKPLKYPHMFSAADLILMGKIDLAPHVDFARETALANVRAVNSRAPVIEVSARTGEGLDTWLDWLRAIDTGSHARKPLIEPSLR
jgi:hydrogenase nickel incorporation protein HypB